MSKAAPHAAHASADVRIVYIAGIGRSGSTLLGDLLGQFTGIRHIGEARTFDRMFDAGRTCGCGNPIETCSVWGPHLEVLNSLDGWSPKRQRIERMAASGSIPVIWRLGNLAWRSYWQRTEEMYRTIASAAGCEVLVDGSKFPSYGRMLQRCTSLPVSIVTIHRDPEAVMRSWMNPKRHADTGELMRRRGLLTTAVQLRFTNRTVNRFWPNPSGRVQFEELVAKPDEVLESTLAAIGCATARKGDAHVQQHTNLGNPSKAKDAPIEIATPAAAPVPLDGWRATLARRLVGRSGTQTSR